MNRTDPNLQSWKAADKLKDCKDAEGIAARDEALKAIAEVEAAIRGLGI